MRLIEFEQRSVSCSKKEPDTENLRKRSSPRMGLVRQVFFSIYYKGLVETFGPIGSHQVEYG